jgi:hypothetical protein
VAGAKVAVTPVGRELMVSVTAALKPATLIVIVPALPPAVRATLVLETTIEDGTPASLTPPSAVGPASVAPASAPASATGGDASAAPFGVPRPVGPS